MGPIFAKLIHLSSTPPEHRQIPGARGKSWRRCINASTMETAPLIGVESQLAHESGRSDCGGHHGYMDGMAPKGEPFSEDQTGGFPAYSVSVSRRCKCKCNTI